ncbi:MAG TPA: hypothetical protein VK843_01180 [Planctomycetota bacterium]|nr:hypothetical protein [Planctomycetota bacterium]
MRKWIVALVLIAVVALFYYQRRAGGGAAPIPLTGVDVEQRPVQRNLASTEVQTLPVADTSETPRSALAAPDTLVCSVLDHLDQPMLGVRVMLLAARPADTELENVDPEESAFLGEAVTPATGRVEFQPADRVRLLVVAEIPHRREDLRAWVGTSKEVVLRAKAQRPQEFGIQVEDEQGRPIAEFRLDLRRDREGSGMIVFADDVKSPDGRVRVPLKGELVRAERLVVSVRAGVEYEPTTREFGREELSSDDYHKIVVPRKQAGLRGFTLNSRGEPIPKTNVGWGTSREGYAPVRSTTDAKGAFVLAAPASSASGFLRARVDGYAPLLVTLPPATILPSGEVILQLDAGSILEGFLSSSEGPVAGARVFVWDGDESPQGPTWGTWSEVAKTDADGKYRLEKLPQGSITLGVDWRTGPGKRGEPRVSSIQRLVIEAPLQRLDIRNGHEITVRGNFAGEKQMARALIALQVLDPRDTSLPWACTSGVGGFETAAPLSTDVILRVWLNPNMFADVQVPASSVDIDLGAVKLPLSKFQKR